MNQYRDNQKSDGVQTRDQDSVFTVSGFLEQLNKLLIQQQVFVMGEVASFKLSDRWASFSLKDEQNEAVLRCYLSRWEYHQIGVQVTDGMKVKVRGYPRITKSNGDLGFVTSSIEPIGEGSLKQAYELLKKKLRAEGLFEQKRSLPEFVQSVGLITSRDGVVIHDFRSNLRKVGIKVYFYDTRVEGKDAIPGIVEALSWFNSQKIDIDVVVMARGGGSLESLQAFDNEVVARAIYASKIPTIAAIGHHVDTPIANLVADKEVSAPIASAYEVNATWDRLFIWLPRYTQDILKSFMNSFNVTKEKIKDSWHSISEFYEDGIVNFKENLALEQKTALSGFTRILNWTRQTVLAKEQYLQAKDPERNLRLGYSIVFHNDRVVKNTKDIKIKDSVRTKTAGGQFISRVEDILS